MNQENVAIKSTDLDAFGKDFEKTKKSGEKPKMVFRRFSSPPKPPAMTDYNLNPNHYIMQGNYETVSPLEEAEVLVSEVEKKQAEEGR
jgi:hypothetical protein